jgi:uncharacterized membrane-anchored protein
VPEVTVFFWIIKALTTAMGESASDFLVHALPPELAVLLGFIAFCTALVVQFRRPAYSAWPYWTAVATVGIFGTMAADVLHVALGVPYALSASAFGIALTAVFIVWHRTEHTLSIHAVTTPRRECFYWCAVVCTFALGTAVGDFVATTLGLGYFGSALLFAGLILLPGIAYRWLGLNGVLAFWTSYVLTRPLGASVADWLGVSRERGGLALGPGPVALVFALLIVGFVWYVARTKVDVPAGA